MPNEIILIRHGKSSYPEGVPDFDRPLAARGLDELPRLGSVLTSMVTGPVHVLVSSARRTEETWQQLGRFLRPTHVEHTSVLYEAPGHVIVNAITSASAQGIDRVMVIGHNPGLESVFCSLVGYAIPLPTSTAVLVRQTKNSEWELAAYLRGRNLPALP